MPVEVADNPAENRFEIHVDDELAGFAAYRREPGRITFTHTEIGDAFEGRGLGSRLASEALDTARANGEQVVPQCPFIAAFIREHRDYLDLVAPEARAQIEA